MSFKFKLVFRKKPGAEEVNAHCIQTAKPRFMAGKALKEAVKNITFEKE